MNKEINKNEKSTRRKNRVRAKITGTEKRPRLTVFRSNTNINCQLIDDDKGVTLLTASSKGAKEKGKKVDIAKKVGSELAKKAKAKGIETVVFDRKGNKYHGRVKALAEGAREGGLKF